MCLIAASGQNTIPFTTYEQKYAKRTQFQKHPNEPNSCQKKKLRQFSSFRPHSKRTQFAPYVVEPVTDYQLPFNQTKNAKRTQFLSAIAFLPSVALAKEGAKADYQLQILPANYRCTRSLPAD